MEQRSGGHSRGSIEVKTTLNLIQPGLAKAMDQRLREINLGQAIFRPCDIALPIKVMISGMKHAPYHFVTLTRCQAQPEVQEFPSPDITTFAYVVLENCLILKRAEYSFLLDLFRAAQPGGTFLFLDSRFS